MKKTAGKLDFIFTFLINSCVLTAFFLLQTPAELNAKEVAEFNRDPQNYNAKLLITDSHKKTIAKFSVAIADTVERKTYGLMNLEKLPNNFGMLFLSPQKQVITMWMKNTLIPLDMIFIDDQNVIINMKTNATPHSLEIISSEKEARKVLEINGGLSTKLGIKIGHKITLN